MIIYIYIIYTTYLYQCILHIRIRCFNLNLGYKYVHVTHCYSIIEISSVLKCSADNHVYVQKNNPSVWEIVLDR